MSNLVQITEDLKGLPMQAVMSYADGQNPQVPPYVALAELNRRKQIQQSGQPPGQMPQQTVAEGVKQQAGVMALQQQQAQQAQGQLMEMMQGQGGGAMSPSDVHTDRGFAKGGVVGLAEGGEVEEGKMSNDRKAWEALKKLWASLPNSTRKREGLGSLSPGYEKERPDDEDRTPARRPGAVELPPAAVAQPSAAPGLKAPAGVAALPGAAKAPVKPEASPTDPIIAKAMEFMAQKPVETTDADKYKSVMERNAMFGIKEPGAGQDARISQMEQMAQRRADMYKQQQGGRGLQNLIKMGSAIATAPGGRQAGVALAAGADKYGSLKDAQGKEDLAQEDKQMELAEKLSTLRNINEQKQDAYRSGNLQQFLLLEKQEAQLKRELQKEQASMAERLATSKQNSDAVRYSADTNARSRIQAAGITAGARTAGAGNSGDKLYDAAINKVENAPEMKALAKQMEMIGAIDPAKGAAITARMEAIRKERMAAMGYKYPLNEAAAPAAAPAAGGWSIQKVN